MIPINTLTRFIRAEERKHSAATGELSDLLASISLGVKLIAQLVATSGVKGLKGYTGRTNVQGERTTILDEEADRILVEVLGSCGHFGLLVSEEQQTVVTANENNPNTKYVVAFDPLDGSGNLSLNIPVATIFSVYRKKEPHRAATMDDFLQCGRSSVVAAGYAVYGSMTTFVYSCGNGVHAFTLDPAIGEFILTDEFIKIPDRGGSYSINEGYRARWEESTLKFIDALKLEDPVRGTPISSRYVGSMAADVDRTLRQGGVYLYPADSKQAQGKLRMLYECIPLAFIITQAGGRASNGSAEILDITPKEIHERSPFVVGSNELVQWYERLRK